MPLSVATLVDVEEGYSRYEIGFSGENLTQDGSAGLLLTIKSETDGYGGLLPGKCIALYYIYSFDINSSAPLGWVRTWGNADYDYSKDVAIDSAKNVYVVGHYYNTLDFDPGPGVDEHIAPSINGFLCKYDYYGNYKWVKTWDPANSRITIDSQDYIYITGYKLHVSKLKSNGDVEWTREWGNSWGYTETGMGLAVDSESNVYVTGIFDDILDFDTGPGIDVHTTNGEKDIFLSKFNSNGDFIWALTWGGIKNDEPRDVVIDQAGGLYVIGTFCEAVDFDPGPGSDIRLTNDDPETPVKGDVFLSKFDTDGNLIWVNTWGGAQGDCGYDLAIAGDDKIIATGIIIGPVDFDPGPGTYYYDDSGVFLSSFNGDGSFNWAGGWHAWAPDTHLRVDANDSGVIYVTSSFRGTIDFDPGPGIVERTSNGADDCYLSKFDIEGNLIWVQTWGSPKQTAAQTDICKSVAVDSLGNAFILGEFEETCDFNPGPGFEWRSSFTAGKPDAFLMKLPPQGYW